MLFIIYVNRCLIPISSMTGVKNEKEIRVEGDEIFEASKSTNNGMGTRASGESHVRFDPINNFLKSWIEKPVEPVSSYYGSVSWFLPSLINSDPICCHHLKRKVLSLYNNFVLLG